MIHFTSSNRNLNKILWFGVQCWMFFLNIKIFWRSEFKRQLFLYRLKFADILTQKLVATIETLTKLTLKIAP